MFLRTFSAIVLSTTFAFAACGKKASKNDDAKPADPVATEGDNKPKESEPKKEPVSGTTDRAAFEADMKKQCIDSAKDAPAEMAGQVDQMCSCSASKTVAAMVQKCGGDDTHVVLSESCKLTSEEATEATSSCEATVEQK